MNIYVNMYMHLPNPSSVYMGKRISNLEMKYKERVGVFISCIYTYKLECKVC